MIIRNRFVLSTALFASMAFAAPALAQPAPDAAITVGVAVSDPQGGAVGTIAAVDGDFVTLKTDRHEVRLPKASFAAGAETGLVMGMTQAEVNAAVEQSLADLGPVLAVGATVRDTAGGVVGTVESFDEEFATIKLSTNRVRLPVTAFGRGAQGPVIAMTAAELEAAAGGGAQ
jgi:preprotein translocase subunit YajC